MRPDVLFQSITIQPDTIVCVQQMITSILTVGAFEETFDTPILADASDNGLGAIISKFSEDTKKLQSKHHLHFSVISVNMYPCIGLSL